jgi:hypothetical protein
MAAITGASFTIPRPGKRKTGGLVRQEPEGSSQTFPIGALLVRTTGQWIASGSSSQSQSVSLVGIAISSGQNQTANGLKNSVYFAFEKGQPIKLTFSCASWIGSVHRGLTAGFFMSSNGSVCLSSGGASTCGTIIDAVEWDTGVAVADGDNFPVVYFVPADAAITY